MNDDIALRRPRRWPIVVITILIALLAYGAGFGTHYFIMTSTAAAEPVEQHGEFNLVAGQEGVVNFPTPFRLAPNVELEVGGFNKTLVSDCTATGFKWKNTAKDDMWNSGKTKWVARGVK